MLRNILIINDDDSISKASADLIRSLSIAENITIIDNATESILYLKKAFRKHPDCIIPELIFLDIDMPEKDGFDFLSDFIYFFSSSKRVPIVYILTDDRSEMVLKIPILYKQVKGCLPLPLREVDLIKIMDSLPGKVR